MSIVNTVFKNQQTRGVSNLTNMEMVNHFERCLALTNSNKKTPIESVVAVSKVD